MMYEQDKAMQYAFYAGVLVLFIFALCYFGTSHVDRGRGEDVRTRIVNSENLNRELQRATENSKAKISGTVERLGDAERELDRATNSIEHCEQIIRRAEQRTQEPGKENK